MRLRHCLSIFVLGVWVSPLVAPSALWAAQSHTAQDLNIEDAIKGVGPNVSGQVAVRSGFVSAKSSRKTPGEIAENISVEVQEGMGQALLPGSDQFTVNGINDAGDVVGSANVRFGSRQCRPNIPEAPPSGICPMSAVHAVIWTKLGGLRDLGTLPGDTSSEAYAINNSGAVVGYSSGVQGTRAFLWTPKAGFQNLGTLPAGDSSKALGLNDNGMIVGSASSPAGTHAVLWDPAKGIQDLDTLPGDFISEAFAINISGSVVGHSKGQAGTRAFIWTSQTGMKSLPSLPGGNVTRALGINKKGEAVGSSGSFDGARAVFWNSKGEAQDLNAVVTTPAGLTLLEAVGINESGQIVALEGDENNTHGFHEGSNRVLLLTPIGQ